MASATCTRVPCCSSCGPKAFDKSFHWPSSKNIIPVSSMCMILNPFWKCTLSKWNVPSPNSWSRICVLFPDRGFPARQYRCLKVHHEHIVVAGKDTFSQTWEIQSLVTQSHCNGWLAWRDHMVARPGSLISLRYQGSWQRRLHVLSYVAFAGLMAGDRVNSVRKFSLMRWKVQISFRDCNKSTRVEHLHGQFYLNTFLR